MRITIGDTSVNITCTAEGKQALKTNKLTPRQRQFILLVAEDTRLAEQAVSNLLPKLDVRALLENGWIYCDDPHVPIFQQPLAMSVFASPDAMTDQLPVKTANQAFTNQSANKKYNANGLQSFLNTYSHEQLASPSARASTVDLPPAMALNQQITIKPTLEAQLKLPAMHQLEPGQALEDIMIVQSLLNE